MFKKEQVLATEDLQKQTSNFKSEVNEIMTTQVDVMDMTAAEIVNEITTAVTTHLESEPMKRIISSNALESFTKVCDSKTHIYTCYVHNDWQFVGHVDSIFSKLVWSVLSEPLLFIIDQLAKI